MDSVCQVQASLLPLSTGIREMQESVKCKSFTDCFVYLLEYFVYIFFVFWQALCVSSYLLGIIFLQFKLFLADFIFIAVSLPTAFTHDAPLAMWTTRVTNRTQQITLIWKRELRKLLQPIANVFYRNFKKICVFSTWFGITSQPSLTARVLAIVMRMQYSTTAREKVPDMSSN